jgi:RimJ/RimL family protein N-acetyltransferase
MQNKTIKIRLARKNDCQSLYDWRNDKNSLEMSYVSEPISYIDHNNWFNNSLTNKNRKIYLGEIDNEKIGVCRFDLIPNKKFTEVSINMNPKYRGFGLGKTFLLQCVEHYLINNKYDLIASIKPKNHGSLKAFNFAGFELYKSNESKILLMKPIKCIKIKEINESDSDLLFDLLKKRKHLISHRSLPKKKEHLKFIKSNPYRFWAIIFEDNEPVGTFYIQHDNSVGLNLLKPKKDIVQKVITEITTNFKPNKEVKSMIPKYFYFNVASSNNDLKEILNKLGHNIIQHSYKL